MSWAIEFDRQGKRDLDKLDSQIRNRVLRFRLVAWRCSKTREALAKLFEALNWEISGNIALAITELLQKLKIEKFRFL